MSYCVKGCCEKPNGPCKGPCEKAAKAGDALRKVLAGSTPCPTDEALRKLVEENKKRELTFESPIRSMLQWAKDNNMVVKRAEAGEYDGGKTNIHRYDEAGQYPEASSPQVDTVVESVRSDLHQRSQLGIKKYGVTLDREDLSLRDWLEHAYQESLDKSLYLKRAIQKIDEAADKSSIH